MAYTQKGYDAGEGTGTSKSNTPSDEKKAEMAKKGLSWNSTKKTWEKVWQGDK
jgi:hypothetical protein